MTKAIWRDSFEIGVEAIDRRHKEMMTLLEEIHRVVDNGRDNRCRGLIARFQEKFIDHFSIEEEILTDTGYPETENHASAHRQLESRCEEIVKRANESDDSKIMAECADDLQALLLTDTIELDMKYKSFLESTEYGADS